MLFYSTSLSVELQEKKIVLDLSATLVQRQKDADLDAKIAELTKDTESSKLFLNTVL